jgi:hypothetical protein
MRDSPNSLRDWAIAVALAGVTTALIGASITQFIEIKKRTFSIDFSNDFLHGSIISPIVAVQPHEKQAEFNRVFDTIDRLSTVDLYRFKGELATPDGDVEFCQRNGKIDCGNLTVWDVKPLVDQVVEFRNHQATEKTGSLAIDISIASLVLSVFTFLMGALKMYLDYRASKGQVPFGI